MLDFQVIFEENLSVEDKCKKLTNKHFILLNKYLSLICNIFVLTEIDV